MTLSGTDNLPVGKKYLGVPMANVPDWWLIWFWDKNKQVYKASPETLYYKSRAVMDYIKEYLPEKVEL